MERSIALLREIMMKKKGCLTCKNVEEYMELAHHKWDMKACDDLVNELYTLYTNTDAKINTIIGRIKGTNNRTPRSDIKY